MQVHCRGENECQQCTQNKHNMSTAKFTKNKKEAVSAVTRPSPHAVRHHLLLSDFLRRTGTHVNNSSPHLEVVAVGAAQIAHKKRRKTEDPGGVRVGFHMWQT